MSTAQLTVGEAGTLDLAALVGYAEGLMEAAPIPDGMTFTVPGTLSGTPTTAGVTEVVCYANDGFGTPTEVGTVTITVVAAELPEPPELVVGEHAVVDLWALLGSTAKAPEYANHDNVPPGMETDTTDRRRIVGTPTTPGDYAVGVWTEDQHGGDEFVGTVNLSVVAESTDPGTGDPDPEDPGTGDPDPEDPDGLDPWDLHERLARALGARVAAFVGQPGNPDVVATAEAQVPIVTEYVRGFTRGRGFRDESPAGPLRAVIVSGVARLATNPEQVAHFQTGDYSERPAQLAGWTLAELGVLHRYRRTTA